MYIHLLLLLLLLLLLEDATPPRRLQHRPPLRLHLAEARVERVMSYYSMLDYSTVQYSIV